MKKCQGLLNHMLYLKKKNNNNANRSLDSSTCFNSSKSKCNTKGNKLKQKASLNQTETNKFINTVIESKQMNSSHKNYNQSAFKNQSQNQNHSFTNGFSSDTFFLHLSNKKSQSPQHQYQQLPYHHPQHMHQHAYHHHNQSQDTKSNPISLKQMTNTKTHSSYYNKTKQKMNSSLNIAETQLTNVSLYQLHRGLLSNMKKNKEKNNKGRQYLNKSMSTYEDEWGNNNNDNKESHSYITQQSFTLLSRIRAIEKRLDDGLKNIQYHNEGKIIANAKSYNLYRVALEELVKEMPKDYHALIAKIIKGYHQIIVSFVSEQKKIIENYDELKTKYSSLSHELSTYKRQTNNRGNDNMITKPIEVNTIQFQKSEALASNITNYKNRPSNKIETNANTNLNSIIGYTNATVNNNTTTTTTNNYIETFKVVLLPYKNNRIEDDTNLKSTNGIKDKKTVEINKIDPEDLEGLYFSDRVDMGDHSSINLTTNVPKLSLNFLG